MRRRDFLKIAGAAAASGRMMGQQPHSFLAPAGSEDAAKTEFATGITDYLTSGGRIEVAQCMAGHSNAKTTGLYDRRNDDVSVGEVERIGI
ncbi:exported hypothetical protein [Candidatus Sulfopaludibacter sp. SbA4]|nr:exported hypothetical protein [Candidatus Sulfopaludibacter sp. SbA4]